MNQPSQQAASPAKGQAKHDRKPRAATGGGGEFWRVWGLSLTLGLAGLIVAWQFVEPAPPSRVVIAAGAQGGMYDAFARQYAQFFADNGIELVVRATAGSVENYELLRDPAAGVQAAIVQGGTAPPEHQRQAIEGVVSVFLEPLWLFHRADDGDPPLDVQGLAGRRVAVGADGSGTQAVVRALLQLNGLVDGDSAVTGLEPVPLAAVAAAEALLAGTIDAAFIVSAPTAPLIEQLLADDRVGLVSFRRSEGYARNLRYLTAVTLHEGSIDLARNLPDRDVQLIAPVAAIAVRRDTHQSVTQLLMRAAWRVHDGGDVLSALGTFPRIEGVELEVSDDTRHYLQRGPNALHRRLPFWAASLIDRMVIMLIPLLGLLLPLVRAAPPVYRWRIRYRIYRWYAKLRLIDSHLREEASADDLRSDTEKIQRLESEVIDVKVPLSYMEEYYNLRLHIAYVRRRLAEELGRESG